MLPTDPPKLSGRDFEPSEMTNNGEDVDMDNEQEEDGEGGSAVELSSVEINILIYLYLLESNFPHTAFTLLSESSLPSTSLFQHFHPSFPTPSSLSRQKGSAGANGQNKGPNGSGVSPTTPTFGMVDGRIPRGELIRKLWKGVRWEEVERHVNKNGEPFKPACPSPFHLLIPHICPSTYPSSSQNPSLPLPGAMRISSPPRRTDPFPPPEIEAGPSRPRSNRVEEPPAGKERLGVNGAVGKKRRSRRNSDEEGDSPARVGKEKEGGKDVVGVRKGDKDKKKGRISGETIASSGKDSEEKRQKGKEKDLEVDTESTIPRIRVRNGSTTANVAGKEDTPPIIEKKRKRDKDNTGELRPPTSNTGTGTGSGSGSGDRRSKSPASASASVSANTTPAVKPRDLPSEKRDRDREKAKTTSTRGDGNPLWISDDLVSIFREHRDSITCVEWNPSNTSLLASGSVDGFARLWELAPASSSSSSSEGPPSALISRYPPETAKHTSIESSLKKVTAMSWHPEGTILATASADGVGRLFTPDGHLQGIMSYGRGQVNAIKFSPDGRSVLMAKNDFVVSLWTIGKGYSQMMNRSYDAHTKEVNDVDWLDDNVFATAGNDQTIFIFHTSDKHIRYTLKGHTDDVTAIRWSPHIPDAPAENRLLASVSDDGFLLIWKLPTYPAERGRMGSRSASPSKTASTPGIPTIPLSGKEDDDYFEKQGKKGREGIEHCIARFCVVSAENKRLNTLEWSPACRDGRMIVAAGGQDSSIKVFDVTASTMLHEFTLEYGTSALAFLPLSVPGYPLGAIAGGSWSGCLGIWDIETGEKRGDWKLDNGNSRLGPGIFDMSWRNDGQQIALAMQNRTVITVATDLKGMANKASKAIKGEKIENA